MKKFLLFLSVVLFASLYANAQLNPTAVTPNAYISEPTYKYIWGTSSDTLTNADTLNFVWRVYGNETYDLVGKLYSDCVSGTAGGTLITYQSIDGVNYEATGDTITVSSLTTDGMDSEEIDLDNFMYPYLKAIYIQSGTAVTIPKFYYCVKKN